MGWGLSIIHFLLLNSKFGKVSSFSNQNSSYNSEFKIDLLFLVTKNEYRISLISIPPLIVSPFFLQTQYYSNF